MSGQQRTDQDAPVAPLWQFVALHEYQTPPTPGAQLAQRRWHALRQLFGRTPVATEPPVIEEQALRRLSAVRLAHLAAPIPWQKVAEQLDLSLQNLHAGTPPLTPLPFVLFQPGNGQSAVMHALRQRRGARLIEPPTPEQILNQDQAWLRQFEQDDNWVLPHLEKCFLRHARGLELVRRLLERLFESPPQDGVIGCNSWGWAYLTQIWPMPPCHRLTLQGLDGAGLARCFGVMAEQAEQDRLHFLDATTGRAMLKLPPAEDAEVGTELQHLAAHCRGNAGIAAAYWRAQLRAAPEETLAERSEAAVPLPPAAETVWVSDLLQAPSVPAEAAEELGFVLHALLLHNGLNLQQLELLLPLSAARVQSLLLRARAAGIVERFQAHWYVAPLGYPVTRDYLRAREYLVDEF